MAIKAVLMERLSEGTYIVAVSGGVDSVVLLDMLATRRDIIVAHFDHGIRDDSADDAKFVGELAKKYGYVFETKREELGKTASEDLARFRRYTFLRGLARKYKAKIITAHHADDVIESIAINLTRGTGWRGLAVLDSPDIERPILGMTKREIVAYAQKHKLEWHEDSTNQSDNYLRNRLRRKLTGLDDDSHRQLLALRVHQVDTKRQIDLEVHKLFDQSLYSRYFFIMIDAPAAVELLRGIFVQESGVSPLSSQLERALLAIKTAEAGASHDVGGGTRLKFTKTEFIVETSEK